MFSKWVKYCLEVTITPTFHKTGLSFSSVSMHPPSPNHRVFIQSLLSFEILYLRHVWSTVRFVQEIRSLNVSEQKSCVIVVEFVVFCVCRMEFRRSTSAQDKPLACLCDPGFGNGFLSSKGRLRRGLPTARTKALASSQRLR